VQFFKCYYFIIDLKKPRIGGPQGQPRIALLWLLRPSEAGYLTTTLLPTPLAISHIMPHNDVKS
jgi:hypothetical protein